MGKMNKSQLNNSVRKNASVLRNRSFQPKKKKAYATMMINNREVRFNQSLLLSIKRLQQSAVDMIPKLPFSRIVREISQTYGDIKWTPQAVAGIQASAELYLTQLFEDSTKCAYHAKRVMVKPNDMHLVLELRGKYDPILS